MYSNKIRLVLQYKKVNKTEKFGLIANPFLF